MKRNYQICTIDKNLDCGSCSLASQVNCSRQKPDQMLAYYAKLAWLVAPSIAILLVGSFYWKSWWLLPAYLAYWVFYQVLAELFIRCRHCPYWDESNPRLDCRINCNVPKFNRFKPARLVRFQPKPMQTWEKVVVQAFSFLVFILPFGIAIILEIKLLAERETQLLALLLAVLIVIQSVGGLVFFRYLTRRLCPDCIHFSCPNNRQPFTVIEAYLAKNPILQEAWKEKLDRYRQRK